jgi:large subunit ribosomal protein L29
MAKTRTNELAEVGDAELRETLASTKDKLFKLRFQRVTGQMDNHAEITRTKRDVAHLLTEMRAREIAAADALAGSEGRKR